MKQKMEQTIIEEAQKLTKLLKDEIFGGISILSNETFRRVEQLHRKVDEYHSLVQNEVEGR